MTSQLTGKILKEYAEGNNRLGVVGFAGKRRTIYLDLVPEAHPGDYVRFHAGFAIECVTAKEAEPEHGQSSMEEPADDKLEVETYQSYRLLGGLDAAQLRKVIRLAEDQRFAAGDIIFHSGDKSSFLRLIVSGEVALEEVKDNRQIPVQTLHAGDALGWSAVTAGAQTHFQARAVSSVSTIAFHGDELREACERDPAMGYAFMKRLLELLAQRVDAMRQQLARTAPEPVRSL